MLFNLLSGVSLELETLSGAFGNLTKPQILKIPLTLTPLMVAFRTTVGSTSELAVYYRAAAREEFSMRVSSGSLARCRLSSVYTEQMLAVVEDASAANTASVEYYILGVKR